MAQKTYPIINNFSRGELSSRVEGRVDLPGYYQGAKVMENCIMVSQGGAEKRPGTIYIGETKDADKQSRLIPFEINDTNIYLIEFGDLYIRIWKDDVLLAGIYGGPAFFTTPYLEAELFEVQYAQTEGAMYFVHTGHDVTKLAFDGTTWTYTDPVVFTASPWSATGEYPGTITLTNQRLAFAGSLSEPQTFWFSQVGSIEDMTQGVNDADGFQFTMAGIRSQIIRWIVDKGVLLVGTSIGEWLVSGGGAGVTPTNILVNQQSAYGNTPIRAVIVSDAVLFVQRGNRKVREFVYSNDDQSYQAPDLTFFADHITESGIVEYDYQQSPDSIVWMVRNDGVLLGQTYDRITGTAGWHRHITDGVVESVAVISGIGTEDSVYISVKRTINSSDIRYIEKFDQRLVEDQEDVIRCDSAGIKTGSDITVNDQLAHLEGETVSILGDGAVYPDEVVSGGQIEISTPVSKIIAGLPYTMKLKPESIEIPGAATLGSKRRISGVLIKVYKTLGLKVGPDEDNLETVRFRSPATPLGIVEELFTGDLEQNINSDSETAASIMMVSDQPLPCTILALVADTAYSRV